MKEYKNFLLKDLFDIQAPKGDIQLKKVKEGKIPFIGAGDENNGVQGYIDDAADGKSIKFKANQITMSIFSRAFYQPNDFFGIGHGVLWILKSKTYQLSELQSLYICTLINQYRDRYDYVTKLNASKAANTEIQLPVDDNGNPDWQYMEDYMKGIMEEVEQALDELSGDISSEEPLPPCQMGTFTYNTFFKKADSQKYLLKNQLIPGNTPVYSATTENNGIQEYCGNNPEFIIDDQHSFYVVFGDHSKSLNIATESFCIMNTAKVLVPVSNNITELIAQYICTVWAQAIPDLGYSRHWAAAEKTIFELPITPTGTPDWDYMERYMQQIMNDMLTKLDKLKEIIQ